MNQINLTEKQIQSQILQWLESQKIFHWRQNTGGMKRRYEDKNGNSKEYFVRFGYPGISDILGCHLGRMFAIEVKRPGGRLTREQKQFLLNLRSAGGVAIVSDSLDGFVYDFTMGLCG